MPLGNEPPFRLVPVSDQLISCQGAVFVHHTCHYHGRGGRGASWRVNDEQRTWIISAYATQGYMGP